MDLLLKKPKDDVKEEEKPGLNGGESTDGAPAPPKIPGDTSPVDGKRPSSSSPIPPDATNTRKQEADLLESTRIEMGEVRQENERLKMVLAQIMKDYNALQKQFHDVVQQDETKKATSSETTIPEPLNHGASTVDEEAEAELVSLSLGRSSGTTVPKREEDVSRPPSASNSGVGKVDGEKRSMSKDLMLGLTAGSKRSSASDSVMSASAQRQPSLSPENSFDDPKEEELGHQWPPSKVLKTMRSGDVDEVSQQISHVKKARVSVRARCDAPTMNDGCQWRKYGQKISKGNPCPRAYYRCTVAPACPVRKQVQRCADDMSILITTYEGTHNHPLPMAATAMASTTAAAASMLLSGSSTAARSSIGAPVVNSTVISAGGPTGASGYPSLHGLNFNVADSSRQRPSYYFPPASPLAPSPSHPTITLDLTNPSPSTSVTTSFPAHLNRFNSSYTSSLSRYPTSLSFSGSTDSASPSPAATSWGSGAAGSYPSYASQLYGSGGKSSHMGGALTIGRQGIQDQLFHQTTVPFWQKNGAAVSSSSSNPSTNAITVASAATGSAIQSALTDTLTKAITSDPSFQTVLAAAITSIVGGGSASAEAVGKSGPSGFKWGDHLPSALSAVSTTSAPTNGGSGGGCAVSYLNREVPPATSTASATMQPKNLMFLQPSLSLSNPKSSSTSPVENRESTS